MPNVIKNKGGRPPSDDPKLDRLNIKIGKRDRSWLNKQGNISDYIRSLIAKDRAERVKN
jgi:hypothetical protein